MKNRPRAQRSARVIIANWIPMLDVIFIVSGIVFFLASAAYADGCDRL